MFTLLGVNELKIMFFFFIFGANFAGFDDIDRGCCGTGLVELGPLCNQFTSLLCSNVSSYMFWDSYHPTERAYRILTKKFVETDMSPFYDK